MSSDTVNITCKACRNAISFKELIYSLSNYGFINLTNHNEEILIFYCCKNDCGKKNILTRSSGELDSFYKVAPFVLPENRLTNGYQYYAPFQFSQNTLKFLRTYNASPITKTIFRHPETYNKSRSEENVQLQTILKAQCDPRFFFSFNLDCKDHFWKDKECYLYDVNTVHDLLKLEDDGNTRFFPRYIAYYPQKVKDIDELLRDKFKKETLLEELNQEYGGQHSFGDWRKQQYTELLSFLQFLTPSNLVSEAELPQDVATEYNKAQVLWKHYHDNVIQSQLSTQFSVFIQEYLAHYSSPHFNFHAVEQLSTYFRNKIYERVTPLYGNVLVSTLVKEKLIKDVKKKAPSFKSFITQDESILQCILDLTQAVKKLRSLPNILITGETGTGKGVLVDGLRRAIDKPFIEAIIPSLSESIIESELFGHKKGAFTGADSDKVGYLEKADQGVVFFDEIGDVPLSSQVKLLGAIQQKQITPVGSTNPVYTDFTLISATRVDLEEAIDNGEFRSDLYYRIKGYAFHIPPLRERKGDILLLATHYVKAWSRSQGYPKMETILFSPEAQAILQNLHLPGNARELEHGIRDLLLKRIVRSDDPAVLTRDITVSELKDSFAELSQHSRKEESHEFPNSRSTTKNISYTLPPVLVAPDSRKMPSKEDVQEMLEVAYHHEETTRGRGLPRKVADHIGVSERYFKLWIKENDIVYPWQK